MRVDEHAALLDAEAVAGAAQHVAVGADIFADALVAAEAVADEVGGDRDQIAVDARECARSRSSAGCAIWDIRRGNWDR